MSFDVFCRLYTIVISTSLLPAAVQTDDNALMFIIIFIFTTVPYRYVNVCHHVFLLLNLFHTCSTCEPLRADIRYC